MILDCIWSNFQRGKNGFPEKRWQELHFNFLWKIPHAFGSDTILFVSVALEFHDIFIWKKKLEGNIQTWRSGIYLDYVINISNLLSAFHVSQRSSPRKSWWMAWQILPGVSWCNVSSGPRNNKTAIFWEIYLQRSQEHKSLFQFPTQNLFFSLRPGGVWEDWILSR